MNPLSVLWPHNFYPGTLNAGVFMYACLQGLQSEGVSPALHYLGNLRNPATMLQARRALRGKAREYELLHAQFGSACGYVVGGVPGRKIVSLRGSDFYRLQEGPLGARAHGFLAQSLTVRSLHNFERVIVMSRRMLESVSRYMDRSLLRVIPDGIDLERFVPMDRAEARAQLQAENDKRPWVLFPSIHHENPIKRPWLARAAVEVARKKIPDIVLKVATGVPHKDMPALINASSAVFMTSTHEGWPNSIKESLACNVPFVSTDVSDLAEIAAVEQSCRVEAPDPERLGAALVAAIEGPRTSTLRRHVEPMCNRAVARSIIELYQETLRV